MSKDKARASNCGPDQQTTIKSSQASWSVLWQALAILERSETAAQETGVKLAKTPPGPPEPNSMS